MIKTLRNMSKQDREKVVVPKSVQAVIPMKTVWEDGIFLVGKNKYAKTYKFEDINYIEHSELTEATLNDRAFHKPETVEDAVSRNMEYELLHRAIAKLPEIQRRRLLLYFFGELTYEQIAELEGCTKRAVKFSIDIALEKLKKDLKNF